MCNSLLIYTLYCNRILSLATALSPRMSADALLTCCSMCQVRIQRFLEKTRKKKVGKDNEDEGDLNTRIKEQKLNKKVTDLMKKQKLRAVRQIVERQDDLKSWGQDAKAKVCIVFCDC